MKSERISLLLFNSDLEEGLLQVARYNYGVESCLHENTPEQVLEWRPWM